MRGRLISGIACLVALAVLCSILGRGCSSTPAPVAPPAPGPVAAPPVTPAPAPAPTTAGGLAVARPHGAGSATTSEEIHVVAGRAADVKETLAGAKKLLEAGAEMVDVHMGPATPTMSSKETRERISELHDDVNYLQGQLVNRKIGKQTCIRVARETSEPAIRRQAETDKRTIESAIATMERKLQKDLTELKAIGCK